MKSGVGHKRSQREAREVTQTSAVELMRPEGVCRSEYELFSL